LGNQGKHKLKERNDAVRDLERNLSRCTFVKNLPYGFAPERLQSRYILSGPLHGYRSFRPRQFEFLAFGPQQSWNRSGAAVRLGKFCLPARSSRRPVQSRAKPELMCPDELSTRSPFPVGRVDLRAVVSVYSDSGFAVWTINPRCVPLRQRAGSGASVSGFQAGNLMAYAAPGHEVFFPVWRSH